jgi:NitT/TauT family transport system substrate-binding protein
MLSGLLVVLVSPHLRAQTDKLIVTHYAGALNGLPYTIALEKGYFKDAGVIITGIIGGAGGGSGVRSLLAGGSLYAEVALPAAITAARQGLDVKIINSCGEGWDQIWVTRPDAPLFSKSAQTTRSRITNPAGGRSRAVKELQPRAITRD